MLGYISQQQIDVKASAKEKDQRPKKKRIIPLRANDLKKRERAKVEA